MQDPRPDPRTDPRPLDFGLFGKAARPALGPVEILAAVLSLLWLLAVGIYAARLPAGSGPMPLFAALSAAVLPLAFLWMAVITARSVSLLRQEAARLQATVDSMRNAYLVQQQAAAAGLKPGTDRKADDGPPPAPRRDTAPATAPLTMPPDRRSSPVPQRPVPADDQPRLALDSPAEDARPPLPVAEVIAALNFPDSGEDAVGIRALRAALADRGTAKLIRSAQDVLTLLAEEGIYMDDLHPDPAEPEVWRRFAQGERGQAVAALGGLQDSESPTRTAARMREDPVFRDAAHHFLRQFDRTFQHIEKAATDAELADLANTRTARAFLLFGRVSGTFD